MSNTHTAHSDQANKAAVRWLIRPVPRRCLLVPFVTTITLQHYLLPSITATVTEPSDDAEIGPALESTLLHAPVDKNSLMRVDRFRALVLKGRTAPERSRGG
jgi:hypothetical protein